MAKKKTKKKKSTNKNTQNRPVQTGPVKNPEVTAAIEALKEGNSVEKQAAFGAALRKARLLSPCEFDIDIRPDENGRLPQLKPSQIRFLLLNTNDGKTFFPAFTDIESVNAFKLGEEKNRNSVVRTISDYDQLVNAPGNKAEGIIINPGKDNMVVPKAMLGILSGRIKPKPVNAQPETPAQAPAAPVKVTYSEPAVYPTKMVNAVYEFCAARDDISRVWFKQKNAGPEKSFIFIVEADSQDIEILNGASEAANAQAKDIPAEAVFVSDELMEEAVKEAFPLFDRELDI